MKYDGDDEIAVSLGSLDRPDIVSPDHSIWTSERLIWANCMDAGLPQFPADPDPRSAVEAWTAAGQDGLHHCCVLDGIAIEVVVEVDPDPLGI